MAFRFTIGKKIGTGFGILIAFVIIVFYSTYQTLNSSTKINDDIININNPSVSSLEELRQTIVRSKMLIFNWIYIQSAPSHPDKKKLLQLTEREYPFIEKRIKELSPNWGKKDQEKIEAVFVNIEQLFELHEEVKTLLPSWESYEDAESKFLANFMVGDDGDIYTKTNEILFQLNDLIDNQKFETLSVTNSMQSSFSFLKNLFKILGVALVVGGILIAIFTTRTIVNPVDKLRLIILDLGKGIFPKSKLKERSDEIGEMTSALNKLVSGLKSTKDFANAVGSGHFTSEYAPLSDEDELGHALLIMRNDLAENERVLEQKVIERTAEVVKQKEEIEKQNEKISELYTEVTDSIRYAKRLQEAILPPDELVKKLLPNSFVLYKPKDIVSGDFYWMDEKNGKTYFSAVDCTGHGVPGAFMSIVGYNALNNAFSKCETPSEILDYLNKEVSQTLHRNSASGTTKDGMDLSICSFDPKTLELNFAGAFNPLYLIRNNEVEQIKADKFPIGAYFDGEPQHYTNNIIQLQKGDYVYIFSDGYADQFGGPKGKKFMYKQFRDDLLELVGKKMDTQKSVLNNTIEAWKGSLEQVDDILVIGLHIV
ncbi:MAG: SpoIIE family protein phosphatase [Flavobacteriales bacterium]|nr:SpoIIE family protein phosphatase [Flavobacteriales bacterium]